MTVRDVAAAVIRLVGLYLAGRVIALTASLLAMPFLISPAAFNNGDALLAASLGSTVGNAVLAAIALTMADAIAAAAAGVAATLRVGTSRGEEHAGGQGEGGDEEGAMSAAE